jgi:hypothetical protein
MNSFRSLCFSGAATLLLIVSAQAATTDERSISITPNFAYKVKLTGSYEAVVYMVQEGDEPDWGAAKLDVEKRCEQYRTMGLTTATPVFEPGWDARRKTKSIVILAKHMTYGFYETHSYDSLSDEPGQKAELCAGTHRVRVHQSVRIRKVLPDRVIDIDFSLQRKKGTSFEGRLGNVYDFREAFGLAANRFVAKADQISGTDQILGLPCSLVKTQVAEDNRITEVCVAVPDDERVPKVMQGRVLSFSSTWTPKDLATRNSRGKATELVPNGLIDTGVFEVPEGIAIKETSDPKLVPKR